MIDSLLAVVTAIIAGFFDARGVLLESRDSVATKRRDRYREHRGKEEPKPGANSALDGLSQARSEPI